MKHPSARVMQGARKAAQQNGSLLVYCPAAKMNPFQRLLYSSLDDRGVTQVPLLSHAELPHVETALYAGVPVAVHLHWTSPVAQDAADPEAAQRRAEGLVEDLQSLKTRGAKLIWTIHNRLPHECPYPDIEVRLRRSIVELADRIHVMASSTAAEVEQIYPLPAAKTIQIPHPSYVGAYPTPPSQSSARIWLGIDHEDFVVGVVGAIQAYKGITDLHQAFVEAAGDSRRTMRMIVAGMPPRSRQALEDLRELDRDPFVEMRLQRLSDVDITDVVAACDVIAVPYRVSLNSGAAMLALSLGRPVVGTRCGSMEEVVGDAGWFAEPADVSSLTKALRAAVEELEPRHHAMALRRAEMFQPSVIADRFADLVVRTNTPQAKPGNGPSAHNEDR